MRRSTIATGECPTPPMLQAAALAGIDGPMPVRHGFFTRRGGVSQGVFASLNVGLGSGDDPAHVAENRRRAAAALGAQALYTPYQVHGADVVVVEDAAMDRVKADAVVTRLPGLAVGVVTADCVPVLIAAPARGVVGAAHAGWRGAVAGIVEATVAAFARLGAQPGGLVAAIGPAIRRDSYEVGEDVRAAVLDRDPRAGALFAPSDRAGHWLFDLPGFVRRRLRRAGVGRIADLGRDTLGEEELFFSYRRSTRRGEPAYGRQLSAILLRDPRGMG